MATGNDKWLVPVVGRGQCRAIIYWADLPTGGPVWSNLGSHVRPTAFTVPATETTLARCDVARYLTPAGQHRLLHAAGDRIVYAHAIFGRRRDYSQDMSREKSMIWLVELIYRDIT